jgi:hypothetical protein
VVNELGGNTEDLHALGEELPAEQPPDTAADGKPKLANRDRLQRRYGNLFLLAGSSVIVLTLLAILAVPEHQAFTIPPVVGDAGTGALLSIGSSFLVVGLIERLGRYARAMNRRVIEDQRAFAVEVIAALGELSEQLRHVTSLVAPLQARLTAIEQVIEKVPEYAEGVMDGAQAMSNSRGTEDSR